MDVRIARLMGKDVLHYCDGGDGDGASISRELARRECDDDDEDDGANEAAKLPSSLRGCVKMSVQTVKCYWVDCDGVGVGDVCNISLDG